MPRVLRLFVRSTYNAVSSAVTADTSLVASTVADNRATLCDSMFGCCADGVTPSSGPYGTGCTTPPPNTTTNATVMTTQPGPTTTAVTESSGSTTTSAAEVYPVCVRTYSDPVSPFHTVRLQSPRFLQLISVCI